MPTPTAEPCIAPMVGLRQWWIARVTRPPLFVNQLLRSLHIQPNLPTPTGRDVESEGQHLPIPMLIDRLQSALEPIHQISARTEYLSRARHNDTLDPVIDIEHAIRLF
jgi:hypothetical protein